MDLVGFKNAGERGNAFGLTCKEMLDYNEIKRKLANGEISLDSPFDGMDIPWTDEEKQKLDEALKKVFGFNDV